MQNLTYKVAFAYVPTNYSKFILLISIIINKKKNILSLFAGMQLANIS